MFNQFFFFPKQGYVAWEDATDVVRSICVYKVNWILFANQSIFVPRTLLRVEWFCWLRKSIDTKKKLLDYRLVTPSHKKLGHCIKHYQECENQHDYLWSGTFFETSSSPDH